MTKSRRAWVGVLAMWAALAMNAGAAEPVGHEKKHAPKVGAVMPKKVEAPKAAPARTVRTVAPVVTHAKAQPVGGACGCGAQIACIGPRGGKYCIQGNGKKRYL